ncbi:MAG: Transglutaminase-like superfamily protein [Methanomassiliicoccales archaeon PtaU1.Bin124]|nr:MAG: Transglutaminase-like superfamily protein [Methanomassiliicoccales archaeon PtaU1.Bin124]
MVSRSSKDTALAIFAAAIVVISSLALFTLERGTSAKDVVDQAAYELGRGNYRTASSLYQKAYVLFDQKGDTVAAEAALIMKFRADRALLEYSLTREEVVEAMKVGFPSLSPSTISQMIDDPSTEKVVSDGVTRYFTDVVMNFAYRDPVLMKDFTQRMGSTPIYDTLLPMIKASQGEERTFFNQTNFLMTGEMTIPRSELPETGVLQVWIPVPISTEYQTNITDSIFPSEYLISIGTETGIGMAYLEIPLEGRTTDVTIRAATTFSEYQQHFEIDPSNIGSYDKAGELYTHYTSSDRNIVISDDTAEIAKAVVGEETNPYIQAKLIYEYVIGNISYSHMPHIAIDALHIPESEYVRIHECGDCGGQSSYFSALLRSLGVPARTCGGYQSFPPGSGTHIWAEYYLPNYGWVPVDVTAAETADWSYNATPEDVRLFKDYFFGNLDMYRMVLQNETDLPLVPGDTERALFKTVVQYPLIVCTTSDQDLSVLSFFYWSLKVAQV